MKLLMYLALILLQLPALAQNRTEFWSKMMVRKAVTEQFTLAADAQFRTQSNYLSHDHNLFQHRMTYSLRLWTSYRFSSRYSAVAAPVAWFRNIAVPTAAENLKQVHELRTAYGLLRDDESGKLKLHNRVLHEVRLLQFDKPESFTQHRYRWQSSATYPVATLSAQSNLSVLAANELFFRTQHRSTGFDQNRITGALQLHIPHADFTAGYQYIYQDFAQQNIHRHVLLVTTNIQL